MVEQTIRLHPAHFTELYPARAVNNCYFDGPARRFYWDAVHGRRRRLKVRIRWYGELFGPASRPVLELKRKSGPVGTKQGFPVAPFSLDRESELPALSGWFPANQLPEEIEPAMGALRPALINRYLRRYLISADRRFRLTFDTRCEFYRVTPPRARVDRSPHDPFITIIELKYAVQHDDLAAEITHRFPFRITKSSKYVMGMERLGAS